MLLVPVLFRRLKKDNVHHSIYLGSLLPSRILFADNLLLFIVYASYPLVVFRLRVSGPFISPFPRDWYIPIIWLSKFLLAAKSNSSGCS